MAINTSETYLMKKGQSAWEKLVDIKSMPDLEGAPEMLETTTLSDKRQKQIPGILTSDGLEFTCNYTKEDYEKLKALEGTEMDFAIWLGASDSEGKVPDGHEGIWEGKGLPTVAKTGGEVNAVQEMTLSIAVSDLEYKEEATEIPGV